MCVVKPYWSWQIVSKLSDNIKIFSFPSCYIYIQKPPVVLKLQKPKKKKKVQWNAGTVDNEFMGKKSSKCELIMLQNFIHLPMPSLLTAFLPPSFLLPSSSPPFSLSLSLSLLPPCLPSSLYSFLPSCFPSFLISFLPDFLPSFLISFLPSWFPSFLLLNLPLLSQVVVCTKNLVFSESLHQKVIQIMMMMTLKATMLTALAIKRNMEIPKSPTKVRKPAEESFVLSFLRTIYTLR